jgi:hypothetical protein
MTFKQTGPAERQLESLYSSGKVLGMDAARGTITVPHLVNELEAETVRHLQNQLQVFKIFLIFIS